MAGPGDEAVAAAAAGGRLRASDADREQMIGTLKAAFVQGRLAKDEFDARIARALASHPYAELATVTADLPARPASARSPRQPSRRVSNALRWGASGLITPAVLATASSFATVRGDGGYAAVAFVIALVYFIFWLSVGADMLWQWHCMSVPSAGMCVRCAHTAASHHGPAYCVARPGSPQLWRRCTCAGYVPPGVSPETADLRVLSAGYP